MRWEEEEGVTVVKGDGCYWDAQGGIGGWVTPVGEERSGMSLSWQRVGRKHLGVLRRGGQTKKQSESSWILYQMSNLHVCFVMFQIDMLKFPLLTKSELGIKLLLAMFARQNVLKFSLNLIGPYPYYSDLDSAIQNKITPDIVVTF
jgi:hypothetical protein